MAHQSRSPSQWMCVVTYRLPDDSDSRTYDQWIREIDNPFFNSVPGVVHYENWKVRKPLRGSADWNYFNFMYVESREAGERIWAIEDVVKFTNGRAEMWAPEPEEAGQCVNYHVCLCEEIAGPIVAQLTQYCLFLLYTPREGSYARGYAEYLREIDNPFFNSDAVPEVVSDANWRVVEHRFAPDDWTDFDLMLVEGDDGWERFCANPKAIAFASEWVKNWSRHPGDKWPEDSPGPGVLGELIASPEKR